MPHFAPDFTHPQTLVWRVQRTDYSGRIALFLFLLLQLWFLLTPPQATRTSPPLCVRPFAWCVLAANSGYALALCGGLLPVWTFFIATFANLVVLALPWQWQAAFAAPDC